ncbi:hypothetical protein K461DRAFT_259040 [Myriangium duriaei CBS 260.36]|uniref:Peroxin 26 n=1 Tax=Myriangium duriaei CBS 260.36 TaxID=1168546 RepID=A0A9P4IY27_9PEZI|nr:hypothetical protein K461DRAFT_259040 [Myriangium duriaei CBS 260.36]
MAPSSVTSVTTAHDDPSHYLSSSISSLSSQRAQSSWLAKTYRQAAQLYLTRRLTEALDAIEPAVFPEAFFSAQSASSSDDDHVSRTAAPVAHSSKGTRVKIWSFYLTLLNAIIELGPEEGKIAFGSTRYKGIVSKAKNGSIWDEVIRHGYNGSEGQVDGEVVANIATLVLTHMPDQRLNQQRLENHLSACMYPAFDIAAHMEASHSGRPQPRRTDSAGTSTPRDLNTRLKLLELYTLHVLPRNEQWDYARDFISMSEVLDEERREAFLNALQSLKEEKSLDAIRASELKRRQEEEAERRKYEEQRRKREETEVEERQKREEQQKQARKSVPDANGSAVSRPISAKASQTNGRDRQAASQPRQNRPIRKNPPPPATFYQRASSALFSIQSSLTHLMQHNPMAALRYFLFVFALVLALARRDIRQRVRRTFDEVLKRIMLTIGMATKVSYI